MKRFFTLWAIMTVLYCKAAFGQFNDTINYHLNYTSTGSANRTNDGDSYLLNNALKFNVSKKSISLNAGSSWVYGQQENKLTNNDFSFALDFNLYKTLPHFYYWGLAVYDKSYSLKINDRLQTGLGVAYNFIDRKNAVVNVSEGILYEENNLFLQDTVHDVYNTFRNSLRLMFRWVIKDIVTLDGTHYLQNSFSNSDDFIIRSNTNLSVKLWKWLSFTTSLTYNKLNRTRRENMLITYGLTVDKYF